MNNKDNGKYAFRVDTKAKVVSSEQGNHYFIRTLLEILQD